MVALKEGHITLLVVLKQYRQRAFPPADLMLHFSRLEVRDGNMESNSSKRQLISREGPDRPIPNTAEWKPRYAPDKLGAVFGAECKAAEERLLQALRHEKDLAIDNFDSGLPFEGLVRRELECLLPRRYAVRSGLVLDRDGRTAGNCDVVVFNDLWFSPAKSPATADSGHAYMPIEGVYAVGEIKQTLSSRELDLGAE
jgi:hypothetical protein